MTVQGEEPAGTPPVGFRVSRGRAPTPSRGRHEMLPAITTVAGRSLGMIRSGIVGAGAADQRRRDCS